MPHFFPRSLLGLALSLSLFVVAPGTQAASEDDDILASVANAEALPADDASSVEELGVPSRVLGHFCTVEHAYPDFSVRLSVYAAELLSPPCPTEHEELRWIPLGELNAAEWAPADAPIVEKLRGAKGI